MQSLDDLDRALIAALREDGRAPVAKLAAILGVTRATVQARLDRLVAAGVVLGFTIRVRQDHDDRTVRAIMLIRVEGRSSNALIRQLRGFPEFAAIHTTNGTWDLIAEIRAPGLQDFDRLLREVRGINGIIGSETSLLLSTISA